MKVQVVTDSTADIPAGMIEKYGIKVVPIYIRFGNKIYRDRVDITNDEFYSKLFSSPDYPATSQPNPEDFTRVYREYCENSSGIVSIHVSSRISGTFNSAMIARKTLESQCPIEVIDSQFNSAGLGLVVTSAARMAQTGASLEEVVIESRRTIGGVGMFGMFETMKYLARSGRVHKTIASASRVLHVMPLLTFRNGEIVRTGLVRTVSKGIDRIYDFVVRNGPLVELVIAHSTVGDEVVQLKSRLKDLIPEDRITTTQLGASLGVHGGPGVLLVAVRRATT